jgi:hypothetical protein
MRSARGTHPWTRYVAALALVVWYLTELRVTRAIHHNPHHSFLFVRGHG